MGKVLHRCHLSLGSYLPEVLVGAMGGLVVGWKPGSSPTGRASLGLHSSITNKAIALCHTKSVVGAPGKARGRGLCNILPRRETGETAERSEIGGVRFAWFASEDGGG